jgi:hypothetical protein
MFLTLIGGGNAIGPVKGWKQLDSVMDGLQFQCEYNGYVEKVPPLSDLGSIKEQLGRYHPLPTWVRAHCCANGSEVTYRDDLGIQETVPITCTLAEIRHKLRNATKRVRAQKAYDPAKRKAKYDPAKAKAQYDPAKAKAQYDPAKAKAQYDPAKAKAQYAKAQYDPAERHARYQEQVDARYQPPPHWVRHAPNADGDCVYYHSREKISETLSAKIVGAALTKALNHRLRMHKQKEERDAKREPCKARVSQQKSVYVSIMTRDGETEPERRDGACFARRVGYGE